MFDQFRERLHLVQQDLSTGLKSLTTKAKEVKRSRRDEISSLQKDIPSAVSRGCNYDAGADILNRFQQMWSEMHRDIETSAEQAMVVDSHVQEVFLNYERRAEPLLQLQKQLMDLPRFVENIQLLTASIGKLEAEFEEVESMILGFEDLIGHCDLLRNKHTQSAELTRYTQQKLKEEGLMRGRLQEEYELSIRIKEESQKANKMERQQAFQDVFAADMQHYMTTGEVQCVVPSEMPRASEDASSIDNFQVAVDVQEQEALDDFLGAPPGGAETREEEADDDGEEEGEEETGGPTLELIEEEGEDEVLAEASSGGEEASATAEETDKAGDKEHQERQDASPDDGGQGGHLGEGATVREQTANQETDEDEEDEFDTPEEGSETENN